MFSWLEIMEDEKKMENSCSEENRIVNNIYEVANIAENVFKKNQY